MRAHQKGYTIVEIMIFLAISGAMLGWSVVAIGQRQKQVEFSQTVRDFENRLKDVINDIATGFFPNAVGYKCVVNNPNLTSSQVQFQPAVGGEETAGSNKDCIFIGKAIQFGVEGTDGEGYNIYTVLGRRLYPANAGGNLRETENLQEAHPTPLLSTGGVSFDYTQTEKLPWGVSITNGPGMIGFFTSFAQVSATGLQSGSLDTKPVVIPADSGGSFDLGQNQNAAVEAIRALETNVPPPFTPQTLCLKRSDGNEYAAVTIGANGRAIDVQTEFKGATPC